MWESYQGADAIGIGGVGKAVRLQPTVAAPQKRITEKRRGVRLNSRVPVSIEWEQQGAGTVREEAFTRIISPYGCLIVLKHNLALEQRIRVVNRATQTTHPAVVVWKGPERPEGWELGIELIQAPPDFWGLEL